MKRAKVMKNVKYSCGAEQVALSKRGWVALVEFARGLLESRDQAVLRDKIIRTKNTAAWKKLAKQTNATNRRMGAAVEKWAKVIIEADKFERRRS